MGKRLDLRQQRFGFWLALKPAGKNQAGQSLWLCQCDCGTQREITTNSLRSGNSTSCGCNHCPDLKNQTFGKLTVIKLDTSQTNKGRRYWLCRCVCKKIVSVSTYRLRNDIITHCGCQTLFFEKELEQEDE